MTSTTTDILGIGFGPSNLALAVAYEESPAVQANLELKFTERDDGVYWHRGMLIPWTVSQVSFVKDLATLRNPRSKFTYLNYLKSIDRLDEFINLGTFNPYRHEISDYLSWVAENITQTECLFNYECERLSPVMEDGRVIKWAAHYTNGEVIAARDVVLSIGRDLYIPEIFRPLLGTRVFHSENYLSAIHQYASKPNLRVAVIGSAQSSAEIFRAVHDDLPSCSPTIIMRKIGFRYYETNPFFNELFYPSQVENFYSLGKSARESILEQMHYTNYGGVAPYLLNELYRLIYQQRARGQKVSKIVTTSDIVEARSESSGIRLVMKDILTGKVTEAVYDLVILGTGFENKPPRLMDSISEHLEQDSDLPVTRFYGVRALPHVEAGLYLQGYSEATHGISDSLLSILAFRSMEILEAIAKTRGHEESESLRKMSVKHAEPA